MRILLIPKNLDIGGAQVDTLSIGRVLARLQHEVIVAAPPGPLSAHLEGMAYVALPERSRRWSRFWHLAALLWRLKPDLAHAVGLYQVLETHFAGLLAGRVPVSASLMSAGLPWTLPESMPATVCMPHVAAFTRRWRVLPPMLLLPPIDMADGVHPARHLWSRGRLRLLIVSRLTRDFKEEGIDRTIRAAATVPEAELVVVGDGPHRPHYEAVARWEAPGRVRFTGAMVDPGPAYGAADIVVGSGVSVLRGMSHGKAAIVLGREGFSAVVGPDTVEDLCWQGFYGVGQGVTDPDPLVKQLRVLAADGGARRRSGGCGLDLVRERYAVEVQAPAVEAFFAAAGTTARPGLWSSSRALGRIAHYHVRRARLRRRGKAMGLSPEAVRNYAGRHLRELALPPAAWGTGRNRSAEPTNVASGSGGGD